MRRVLALVALPLAIVLLVQNYAAGADRESEGEKLVQQLDNLGTAIMRHERLIAACMAEKGFDYKPSLPAGYVLERANVLAAAEGRTYDPSAVDLPQDPNASVLARLTQAEKDARADALWGNEYRGGSDLGCYHETYKQAWGALPALDEATVARLDAVLYANVRVQAARRLYSHCMADKGYAVADPRVDIFELYLGPEEELAAQIQSAGGDPLQSPEWNAHLARRTQAFAAHDECVRPYREVENAVKLEILKAERPR